MLKDAIRFSYINAKIRSLKGQLLGQSDYENLLKARGYHGLAECLRFTSYCKNIGENISSYDELIEIYYKNILKDYVKVIDSLSGNIRHLVYQLYQRYELENLKVILRAICYYRQKEKTKRLLFPFIKYHNFSINDLLASKDLFELIQRLKGTWYHEPLVNSFYRFENEGETFPLEMALDLSYYKQIWEIISSLSRKDQKITKAILGLQLDALNIMWIMRFKERFHFSPEEILNYSLVYGTYISKNIRKKLAYSVNQKDIISNLEGTPYKKILQGIDDPEIGYVKLLQYTLLLVKKNWHRYPFQIGTILDYIFLKEMEIKDLITITEGKRIGIPEKNINLYMVQQLLLTC
jgi:V/A-type H+-transporting ATPase subunit C